jgi:hypothetical protein
MTMIQLVKIILNIITPVLEEALKKYRVQKGGKNFFKSISRRYFWKAYRKIIFLSVKMIRPFRWSANLPILFVAD